MQERKSHREKRKTNQFELTEVLSN